MGHDGLLFLRDYLFFGERPYQTCLFDQLMMMMSMGVSFFIHLFVSINCEREIKENQLFQLITLETGIYTYVYQRDFIIVTNEGRHGPSIHHPTYQPTHVHPSENENENKALITSISL